MPLPRAVLLRMILSSESTSIPASPLQPLALCTEKPSRTTPAALMVMAEPSSDSTCGWRPSQAMPFKIMGLSTTSFSRYSPAYTSILSPEEAEFMAAWILSP